MADYLVTDTELTSIADAIRTKGGTSSSLIFPDEFVSAINDISTGITPSGTISISSNGTFNVTNYASARVSVVDLDVKNILNRKISYYENPYADTLGWYAFYSCSQLKEVSFTSVYDVGSYAFALCSQLSSVYMPSAKILGPSAFYICKALVTVSFPSVSTLYDTFVGCSNLTTVDMPSLTRIYGGAFSGCTKLSVFDMTNISGTLGDYAFCSTALSFASNSKISSIGIGAFRNCSSLTSVSFPEVSKLGQAAFSGCSSLTSFYMPKLQDIGDTAFCGCKILGPVVSLSSATVLRMSAFYGCESLEAVDFPQMQSIYGRVFAYCYSLSVASIGNCNMISSFAFSSCSALKSLYIYASSVCVLKQAANSVFVGTQLSSGGSGYIYVPSSLVASYKSATNWVAVSARITSIPE